MKRTIVLFAILAPTAPRAQECAPPRILFDFDVSGSMAWDSCGSRFVEVDHTLECPGVDVECATCAADGCDNGLPDDGRLYKVKTATTEVVNDFPEVEFALARFHQAPQTFGCKHGGWKGGPTQCFLAPLGVDFNAGDILVEFATDSRADFLEWIDGEDNYEAVANPSPDCSLCADCGNGCDKELRPAGPTPIGGSLFSVRQYLEGVRAADPLLDSRAYAVIVLTDGQNNCPDPATGLDPSAEQAAALCEAGVPVFVIGFNAPVLADKLNWIAEAGCAPGCQDPDGDGVSNCSNEAYLVDTQNDLTTAMADIVRAVDPETCNGLDDDCDGVTDEEPIAGSGLPCGTDEGECRAGLTCCNEAVVECCGEVGPTAETCDCLDNDCDGLTDEDDVCGGGSCECDACAPHTQGYWHRQCLGCGLIEGDGQLPGPHPDYTCEEFAALTAVTDGQLDRFGQDTCTALDADPPSDPCERALKQTAALLLNIASGLVSADCRLNDEADGAAADQLGTLVTDLIEAGECKEAVDRADAFNTGKLCPAPVTAADGGADGALAVDGGGADPDGGGDPARRDGAVDARAPGTAVELVGHGCVCGVAWTVPGASPWWVTMGLWIAISLLSLRKKRARR